MSDDRPQKLIDLLDRLGLATAAQVAAVAGRARRLARGLPLLDSVWVDALAQARLLTPYQAGQINAGRGEQLRVGPYVLCQPLEWPLVADCFRARDPLSKESVRLVVVDRPAGRGTDVLRRLEALAARAETIGSEGIAAIHRAGADGDRRWAASAWIDGRSASQWLVHNGRFAPEVVLEIARQMAQILARLENEGLCHGDLSAAALVLRDGGEVVLLQPGLRAIVRPEEGYAHADLPPEAYDYLAPERVSDGTPGDGAGDRYACGCVWWHLLTGRPPLAGGSSLAKLRFAQMAAIPEVRRFAPDTPAPLAATIAACVAPQPKCRPESMARLVAMLGPSTRTGQALLARCLSRPVSHVPQWGTSTDARRLSVRRSSGLAVAAAGLVVVAAILVPLGRAWSARHSPRQLPASSAEGSKAVGQRPVPTPRLNTGQGGPDDASTAVPSDRFAAAPAASPGGDTPDLVLEAGRAVEAETLVFRPGQHVRGPQGKRPSVVVRSAGLRVGVENVVFENLDFAWEPTDRTRSLPASKLALIDLEASRAEFHGCRFQVVASGASRPVAIRWIYPASRADAVLALPSGRVQLKDCVLRGVDGAVDCQTAGAMALEAGNTLYLGAGPCFRLGHCPAADEPVVLVLSRVTLRGSGPLLECCYDVVAESPGSISIRAQQCAVLPRPDTAILAWRGNEPPARMAENTRWIGQGTLVGPKTVIAAWLPPTGPVRVLDESAVAIEGVVRSEVAFAGAAEAEAEASRIVRWQVPLRSPDPPGFNPDGLP